MSQEKSKEEEFLEKVAELAQEYDVEFMTFTKSAKGSIEKDGQEHPAYQLMARGNGSMVLAHAIYKAMARVLERAETYQEVQEVMRRFTREN